MKINNGKSKFNIIFSSLICLCCIFVLAAIFIFSNQNIKFDLIFVDPPYDYNVYEKILDKVSTLNLLNENGLIILEHSNLKFKEVYNNLTLYKEKKYGNKSVNIYKIN